MSMRMRMRARRRGAALPMKFGTAFVVILAVLLGAAPQASAAEYELTPAIVAPAQVSPGDTLTWEFSVTNTGDSPVPYLDMYGTMPTGLTNVRITGITLDGIDPGDLFAYYMTISTSSGPLTPPIGIPATPIDLGDSASLLPLPLTYLENGFRARLGVSGALGIIPGLSVRFTLEATVADAVGPITTCVNVYTFHSAGLEEPVRECTDTDILVAIPNPDLALDKTVTSTGPYAQGSTVTYLLTPRNDGADSIASAGWSVTDLLPAGLTASAIEGSTSHYDCQLTTLTCTNDQPFPSGADLGTVTVTATVTGLFTGTGHNVAYVSPAEGDTELVPLEIPAADADTEESSTNNDAQADLEIKPVSVGDFVWLDANRNGLRDSGEAGVPGVAVDLVDAAGHHRSTTTDASGFYWFTGLMPGAHYSLSFSVPPGHLWTTRGATVDGAAVPATDSDVAADGTVSFTAPRTGSNGSGGPDKTDLPNIDAGLVTVPPPAIPQTPVGPAPELPVSLPQTGSSVSSWTPVGFGAILAGAVLIAISRRGRRRAS